MGFRVIALSTGSAKESLARELGAHDYLDGSKVDQVAALHESLEGMRAGFEDLDTFVTADAAFHRVLGAAAGNPIVTDLLAESMASLTISKKQASA